MDNNFYRDDFEQMLKDTTDDFRMYPSRKVWHSIYNNRHPDRKWPSLAVCLILLTTILHIGVSNNLSISKNTRNLIALSIANGSNVENNSLTQKKATLKIQSQSGSFPINHSTINEQTNIANTQHQLIVDPIDATSVNVAPRAIDTEKDISIIKTVTQNVYTGNEKPADEKNIAAFVSTPAIDPLLTPTENKSTLFNIDTESLDTETKTEELNIETNKNPTPQSTVNVAQLTVEDKKWIEDYAFHNLRNKDKWKSNLSFQYYITPSVGYRTLVKNNEFQPANGILMRTSVNNEFSINQQAAPNLEAGTGVLYDLNKRIKFKTGIQFNYSSYVTNAHELKHPTQTTVLMNDLHNGTIMPVSYSSNYGNVLGSNFNKLNNKTIQVSIPVGLDYKLTGTDKIKWYVGATIQPTYVSSGNAYLISADNKNFASDPSLLRSWNVNSSIETFVSIKMPSGASINLGPQFRYQLLSTYSKQYTYSEKLFNFGFKLGVSKKF